MKKRRKDVEWGFFGIIFRFLIVLYGRHTKGEVKEQCMGGERAGMKEQCRSSVGAKGYNG